MKKLVMLFAFVLISQIGMAQSGDAMKGEVIKFLEVSGMKGQVDGIKGQLLAAVADDKKADFTKEFDSSVNNLIDKSTKVIGKYYTLEQFKGSMKDIETTRQLNLPEIENGQQFNDELGKVNEEFSLELQGIMEKYVSQE